MGEMCPICVSKASGKRATGRFGESFSMPWLVIGQHVVEHEQGGKVPSRNPRSASGKFATANRTAASASDFFLRSPGLAISQTASAN